MDTDRMRRINRDGYNAGQHHAMHRDGRTLHAVEERFFDTMLAGLPDRPRVLDLGCGSGVPFDRELVDRGCEVVGIDIAEKHIRQAREGVPEATFIQTAFTDLSPVDGTFDAAICLYALVHAHRQDHDTIFNRVADRLEKGGLFLLTISRKPCNPETEEFAGGTVAWSAWPEEKTRTLLQDAGFSITREAPVRDAPGLWPYRLVLAERA